MTDRRAGIAIGLVLGVAAIVLFVFVLSDDTVDAPAVDETTTEAERPETDEPGGGRGNGRPGASKPEGTPEPDAPAESDAPAEPPIPTIKVEDGQPVGGVQTLETDKGARVTFQVRSDVADHVHVHGYDLIKDVEAGGQVRFSFAAEIDGIFEIELENSGVEIAELRVNP